MPMANDILLKIADIELDSRRMEVRRAQKIISLTPLEFKLLEYLIRNKNTVVSRKELLTQLWQYSPDIQTRVVDVYIGYLRKKIDGQSTRKLISSIRGMGYTIREDL